MGNGLEINEVDFKVNAGPDREPMEITNHICHAGVHVGFNYRMYSIQGGLSHNAIALATDMAVSWSRCLQMRLNCRMW